MFVYKFHYTNKYTQTHTHISIIRQHAPTFKHPYSYFPHVYTSMNECAYTYWYAFMCVRLCVCVCIKYASCLSHIHMWVKHPIPPVFFCFSIARLFICARYMHINKKINESYRILRNIGLFGRYMCFLHAWDITHACGSIEVHELWMMYTRIYQIHILYT